MTLILLLNNKISIYIARKKYYILFFLTLCFLLQATPYHEYSRQYRTPRAPMAIRMINWASNLTR